MEKPCWVYPANSINFLRKSWSTYDCKVPFIISDLIKALNDREGYKTNGIFREKVEDYKIEERLQSMDNGELREFPEEDTPLLLACVLKKYIKNV